MCSGCHSQKLIADLTFLGYVLGGYVIEFFMKMQRKNFECEKYSLIDKRTVWFLGPTCGK